MLVHPLIFEPIYKHRIWGGARIFSYLGRTAPGNQPIGESWELVDLEGEDSKAAVGPVRGRGLHQLMEEWGSALLGRVAPIDGRFPLLIKYLDARENLSVQVHPDARIARRLGGAVRVKHEAWYILEAAPGGFIYHGLREGTSPDAFRQAMLAGCPDEVLRRVAVRAGECYYLPSGTPHGLGAGVLVAEIQTPSDITYRTYDWGRLDPESGRPRDLHLDEAMACIDFTAAPPPLRQERSHVASLWTAVTRLAACPSFVIERVRMVEGIEQQIPYAEPVVWIVLEGAGEIDWRRGARPIRFQRGDVVLLPALMEEPRVRLSMASQWLEVTVPVQSDLAGLERPTPETLQGAPMNRLIQINLPRQQ